MKSPSYCTHDRKTGEVVAHYGPDDEGPTKIIVPAGTPKNSPLYDQVPLPCWAKGAGYTSYGQIVRGEKPS